MREGKLHLGTNFFEKKKIGHQVLFCVQVSKHSLHEINHIHVNTCQDFNFKSEVQNNTIRDRSDSLTVLHLAPARVAVSSEACCRVSPHLLVFWVCLWMQVWLEENTRTRSTPWLC